MGQAFKRDLIKRYDLDLVPLLEDGVRVMLYNGATQWLSPQMLSHCIACCSTPASALCRVVEQQGAGRSDQASMS